MNAPIRFLPILFFAFILAAGAPGADRTEEELRAGIILTAKKHLGALYRYGGMGARGFDCSGFAQFVYRENGITLPRSTVDQYEQGRKIDLADAKPGDLLFFKIYRNRVSHVGIYVDAHTFIHAPTWGKRVSFANMKLDYWKRTFVGAASYIGNGEKPGKSGNATALPAP